MESKSINDTDDTLGSDLEQLPKDAADTFGSGGGDQSDEDKVFNPIMAMLKDIANLNQMTMSVLRSTIRHENSVLRMLEKQFTSKRSSEKDQVALHCLIEAPSVEMEVPEQLSVKRNEPYHEHSSEMLPEVVTSADSSENRHHPIDISSSSEELPYTEEHPCIVELSSIEETPSVEEFQVAEIIEMTESSETTLSDAESELHERTEHAAAPDDIVEANLFPYENYDVDTTHLLPKRSMRKKDKAEAPTKAGWLSSLAAENHAYFTSGDGWDLGVFAEVAFLDMIPIHEHIIRGTMIQHIAGAGSILLSPFRTYHITYQVHAIRPFSSIPLCTELRLNGKQAGGIAVQSGTQGSGGSQAHGTSIIRTTEGVQLLSVVNLSNTPTRFNYLALSIVMLDT